MTTNPELENNEPEIKQDANKTSLTSSDMDLPSLDQLSVGDEPCTNQNCGCRRRHKRSGTTMEDGQQGESLFGVRSPKLFCKSLEPDDLAKTNQKLREKVLIKSARLHIPKDHGTQKKTALSESENGNEKEKGAAANGVNSNKTPTDFRSLAGSIQTVADIDQGKMASFCTPAFSKLRDEALRLPANFNFRAQSSKSNVEQTRKTISEVNLQELKSVLPDVTTDATINSSSCSGHAAEHAVDSSENATSMPCSCSQQALTESIDDWTMDELAGHFENYCHIPRKMSEMAKMMYA